MIGIVIANTGSPAAPEPEAIEAFLREYLMDDRIRQMPKPFWKWLLNKHILPRRKYSSAERYRRVWTEDGSPLVATHGSLVKLVQDLFDEDRGPDSVLVRSAMAYGHPSMEDALVSLREADVDKVVLLPLYPQSGYSCTLTIVDAFRRTQGALGWRPESTVIDNYHDDEGYIGAIARSVESVGFDASAGDRLLLSFHAAPLKDEKAGDTYRKQIEESAGLLAARLGIPQEQYVIGFQSVFGHKQDAWTGPLSQDILQQWQDGDFRVFFCCPGFVIDCLETLDDIPQVMAPALEGAGNEGEGDAAGRFVWVPTLNDSLEHAQLVKDVLERYL